MRHFKKYDNLSPTGLQNVSTNIVYHCCRSLEIAEKIFKGGFAALSTLDEGFYGRGIYFSHNFEYSAMYGINFGTETFCVMTCAVVYGNPYPVIEKPVKMTVDSSAISLMGRSCMPRYDAHVTIVSRKENYFPMPLEGFCVLCTIAKHFNTLLLLLFI